ncbi:hypothetical protein SISSUDRAFT_1131322 [Sistotremastrum suecicum HHB10207 ss-3]|uniref:F-box domain-containing protein n=1 Tax=Sistotremastrum suecicum HHB10207 ss-3 TaxID=1314776 RepID=A0A166ABA1_9AGAM|nr:hypothetical protein SISSUDRAFT_1131322 [Sistotremastrum suecicum HHB10207 ss-3]
MSLNILELSEDVIIHMFKFSSLSITDIVQFSRTCRPFRKIAYSSIEIWRGAYDLYRIVFPLGESLASATPHEMMLYACRAMTQSSMFRRPVITPRQQTLLHPIISDLPAPWAVAGPPIWPGVVDFPQWVDILPGGRVIMLNWRYKCTFHTTSGLRIGYIPFSSLLNKTCLEGDRTDQRLAVLGEGGEFVIYSMQFEYVDWADLAAPVGFRHRKLASFTTFPLVRSVFGFTNERVLRFIPRPGASLIMMTHTHTIVIVDYAAHTAIMLSPEELSNSAIRPHSVIEPSLDIVSAIVHPDPDSQMIYLRTDLQLLHVITIPHETEFHPIPIENSLTDLPFLYYTKASTFIIPDTPIGESFRRTPYECVVNVFYEESHRLPTPGGKSEGIDIKMITLALRDGSLGSLHPPMALALPPITAIKSFRSSVNPYASFSSILTISREERYRLAYSPFIPETENGLIRVDANATPLNGREAKVLATAAEKVVVVPFPAHFFGDEDVPDAGGMSVVRRVRKVRATDYIQPAFSTSASDNNHPDSTVDPQSVSMPSEVDVSFDPSRPLITVSSGLLDAPKQRPTNFSEWFDGVKDKMKVIAFDEIHGLMVVSNDKVFYVVRY